MLIKKWLNRFLELFQRLIFKKCSNIASFNQFLKKLFLKTARVTAQCNKSEVAQQLNIKNENSKHK
jgi:hypothetical protein